jgi:hypothetical protein
VILKELAGLVRTTDQREEFEAALRAASESAREGG